MRAHVAARLGILACTWFLAGCAGSAAMGPGWTFGPTTPVDSIAPGPGTTPWASTALASSAPTSSMAPSPIADASPTADARPPLPYPKVQSHGLVTVAFRKPALPSVNLDLVCEWVSPVDVGYFYVVPSPKPFAGEQVYFEVQPKSPGYQFWIGRKNAASYHPGPRTGSVALDEIGDGWASGSMWFNGLAPDPYAGPGPLTTSIEAWVRPIGGDATLARLSGTVTWACEPAPPTVPTPGPVSTEQPAPTIPPLPHLTLVSGDVHREAVSGCGTSIYIGGYTAADSCGPSFQALGVDYIVRVPKGGKLRFELPAGWHFAGWYLGWVTQIEAERWHGEEPDTFRGSQTGTATSGRTIEVDAPPPGDWSVRLDWRGARGDDRFGVPDYFRVIVGG